MEVAGYAFSLHVVIVVVLFAGAFADAGYVLILVDVTGYGYPGVARGRALGFGVEPAVFYSRDQSKGEHRGT
jgi:hypothetical protein